MSSVNSFGRLAAPQDARDLRFTMRGAKPQINAAIGKPKPRTKPYRDGPLLDQGNTSQCVGYSSRGFLDGAPIMLTASSGPSAAQIYHDAQDRDEWPGCVDQETQCLTARGWINGDDLRVGDEIVAFDTESETLRWTLVQAVHRFADAPYRVFENAQFSCAVTDSHKWLVSNRLTLGGPFLRNTLSLKSQDEVWRSAPCGDQPIVPIVHDDLVEMIAWAVTEGHYRPEYRRGNEIAISQKSHRSRVAELMFRMGVSKGYEQKDTDGVHVWTLSGAIADAVRDAAPEKTPTIAWLRQLTQRQLRLFIDACTLADGSVVDGEPWNRLSRSMFHQRPETGTLDSFLAASVLAGVPVSRSSDRPYTVNFSNEVRHMQSWSLRESSRLAVRKLIASEYRRGPVWCPQTTYGTFIARRACSIFITGNSNYDGTSVRGAMKALTDDGQIGSYVWGQTVDEAIAWLIGGYGTLITGTDWFAEMSDVDSKGFMREPAPSGTTPIGGHAWRIVWFDAKLQAFIMRNSWGNAYGWPMRGSSDKLSGYARIRKDFLEWLLRRDGELAAPVQVRLKPTSPTGIILPSVAVMEPVLSSASPANGRKKKGSRR